MIYLQKEILEFYKQTSCYTDLGFYKEFAENLPDEIEELCLLQRSQIIHPFELSREARKNKNSPYGDLTQVSTTRLRFESDLFPTAQSILAELLRRDEKYSIYRDVKNKLHLCCREQAILLASILKAKEIPARVRSGFVYYVASEDSAGDHWITEYYNESENRWILVDPDMFFYMTSLEDFKFEFSFLDIPRNKFIFGAEAYLKLRKKLLKEGQIHYASNPITLGFPAAIRVLFYDFHSLMNDEIIFLHVPKYIKEKNFELTEEEYKELDELAELLLEPDTNFEKIKTVWKTNLKFRILSGGLN